MEPAHPQRGLPVRLVHGFFGFGIWLGLGLLPVVAEEVPNPVSTLRWEPYVGETLDGSPLEGELGRLRVPENRSVSSGREIELVFVRFRTTHPDPGPPVFFLAGGPGGSGVEGSAVVASHPQIRLLEQHDVIGVDQRGTGRSGPSLTEGEAVRALPLDRELRREALVTALEGVVRETVELWRDRGVDLGAYHSVESADDLEAVRQALGLDKILLYGTSYGSHLGLAYLRRHGEHVARAVLTKVEGPNHTFKLPSTVQRHLEHLHRLSDEDPALDGRLPDLLGTVEALLHRLAKAPVAVTDEAGEEVVVGALDLQVHLARALADTRSMAGLPASLHRFEAGDWGDLLETARDNRQVGVHALGLTMDCASGATAERRQRLEKERQDPRNLLADAILTPFYLEACDVAGLPDLGDIYRSAFETQVPTLLVSGTLDVRTPPENVEEILAGFHQGFHVVVENAGHESRELMSPEYRDLLQTFLRGEPIESVRITLPEPVFESLSNPEAENP